MKINKINPIKKYSKFADEDQILLEPYSQFKVIDIKDDSLKHGFQTITFKRVILEQISDE